MPTATTRARKRARARTKARATTRTAMRPGRSTGRSRCPHGPRLQNKYSGPQTGAWTSNSGYIDSEIDRLVR
eukprot:7895211-Pyramimonas_sp.AAC.1